MRKLWVLAYKEVKLTFRDIGALVSMLVTPLALTLVMAAAFGTGTGNPISDIPLLVLNQDEGTMGEELSDIFTLDEVSDLVAVEMVDDEAAARARVEADEVAALVIIPADFSAHVFPLGQQIESILGTDLTSLSDETVVSEEQQVAISMAYLQSMAGDSPADPVVVEIYASPDWRISTSVIKSIITQGLEIMHLQIEGISRMMGRLASAPGAISEDAEPTDYFGSMSGMADEISPDAVSQDLPVALAITSASGRGFSWLGYYASSMSVLFLMFAVTSGGRTLLAERDMGTLPRLMVSPTPALSILLGKMGGIVLSGTLQVVILWGATTLIGAYWGPPLLVFLAIVIVVFCASSVGALISAWAKSPGQAGAIGSAVTLVGSAVSGSFFSRFGLPVWLQTLSLVLPNAWGIELFSALQAGGTFVDILPLLGGTLLLTVIYYGVASLGFRRQFA